MFSVKGNNVSSLSGRFALSSALIVGAIALAAAPPASAQTYPGFTSAAIPDYSIGVQGGVNAASVPNGLYGTALLSVYVTSGSNALGYTVSTSGNNAVYSDTVPYAIPQVNCTAATPSTCAVAIRYFNNQIYLAYSDTTTHQLDVAIATPIAGNVGYTFSTLYQDSTGVQMVTAPEMEAVAGRLAIVFGSSSNPNVHNAYYSVTTDGTTFTPASQQYLGSVNIASPAKPGMAVLGSTLWMCFQQNASSHQLFTYYSTDGIVWTFGTQFSGLALGGGASMVSANNTLYLLSWNPI
jgi:hypothetical protein